MNEEKCFEKYAYALSIKIMENTSSDNPFSGNAIIDDEEQMLLYTVIYYFANNENISTSELIKSIKDIINKIDDIEDFHNSFINANSVEVKSMYLNSYYYEVWDEYIANKEEKEWVLITFKMALKGVKYRVNLYSIEQLVDIVSRK